MSILRRLVLAAYGMHLADQIALVSVPLVAAVVFHATAGTIGLLVAAQSMAHLLGSLPFGLIVDRVQPRILAIIATSISFAGFSGVAFSIVFDNLIGFGLMVAISGFGIVLFVLVCLSVLPRVMGAETLAMANARFEFPRALTSFAVPLWVGLMVSASGIHWLFPVAAMGGLLALILVCRFPEFELTHVKGERGESIVNRLVKGSVFVVANPYLLPVTICAVFWNLAFSALLVVMVPLLVERFFLEPAAFGACLSFFGAGAIAGTWTAGRVASHVSPSTILLAGPGSSLLGASLLLVSSAPPPAILIYGPFFVLGFGPSMWLICQNSIRQLVTPVEMLGRVNAVVQTTIYGVRPLGALLGGLVVSAASANAGLVFVTLCFAGSLATVVFSRLTTIRHYTDLAPGCV